MNFFSSNLVVITIQAYYTFRILYQPMPTSACPTNKQVKVKPTLFLSHWAAVSKTADISLHQQLPPFCTHDSRDGIAGVYFQYWGHTAVQQGQF